MNSTPSIVPPNCALIPGRFQPFHDGHEALARKALLTHNAVVFLIRDRRRLEKFTPDQIALQIKARFGPEWRRRVFWFRIPDFATIVYGRDVGFEIKKLDLAPEIEAISATALRAKGE